MKTAKSSLGFAVAFAFLVAVLALPLTPAFASAPGQKVDVQNDRQIKSELIEKLNKDRFKNVQVSVNEAIVTLTGTVDLFAAKEEADRIAQHVRNTTAVRNHIGVAETRVTDQELQSQLMKKLAYDRVGYGTTAFNAVSVNVRDGVVTLGGHAYSPTDKSSALSVASYTPGVQDVIDQIEIDPVSPMDDRIRLNVARAIYGHPALLKYSIDPGKPIRISVQNGNVTLYGSVDNAADKDIAYIRANSVPGVFKVANELNVEGAISERD
jgi:osmotically-inducible protein OsmY